MWNGGAQEYGKRPLRLSVEGKGDTGEKPGAILDHECQWLMNSYGWLAPTATACLRPEERDQCVNRDSSECEQGNTRVKSAGL